MKAILTNFIYEQMTYERETQNHDIATIFLSSLQPNKIKKRSIQIIGQTNSFAQKLFNWPTITNTNQRALTKCILVIHTPTLNKLKVMCFPHQTL